MKELRQLNNLVQFDQAIYDKLVKEVPIYKLVTLSIVSKRMKVRGSLAHKALRELLAKGLIKQVVWYNSQAIHTRLIKDDEETEAGAAAADKK